MFPYAYTCQLLYIFLYIGAIDTNAVTFGNSWKTQSCKDVPISKLNPCNIQVQRAAIAEQKCNLLQSTAFSASNNEIDPSYYIERCKQDVCSCRNGEVCLCDAIDSYTQDGAMKGIIVEWRNGNILPECGK